MAGTDEAEVKTRSYVVLERQTSRLPRVAYDAFLEIEAESPDEAIRQVARKRATPVSEYVAIADRFFVKRKVSVAQVICVGDQEIAAANQLSLEPTIVDAEVLAAESAA